MKNLKENIKNIVKNLSNNRGAISGNIVKGLSLAVFATVVLYGVYTSYHNSPAYNPARRALYINQGQNLSANSLEGFYLSLGNSGALPKGSGYTGNVLSGTDGFKGKNYIKNKLAQGEAEFEEARVYMESKREQAKQTQNANETDGVIKSKDGVRNAYNNRKGVTAKGFSAATKDEVAAAGKKDTDKSAKAGKNGKAGGVMQSQPQTQLNKLASGASSGSAFSGGGSSGSSSNFGGDSLSSVADSSSRALPQKDIASAPVNSDAFKMGRGGAVGGINVVSAGGALSEGTRGAKGGAGDQLRSAHAYSQRAGKSIQTVGSKSLEKAAQEADNAFDGGGVIESGATINGDNVVDPGNADFNFDPGGGVLDSLKDIGDSEEDSATEQRRLQGYVTYHMIYAAIAALSAAIAIAALKDSDNIYAWIGIAFLASMATYSIWGMDYDGDGMGIVDTLKRLDELRSMHNQNPTKGWYYLLLGALEGVVGAAAVWGEEIAGWAEEKLGGLWEFLSKSMTAGQVAKGVKQIGGKVIEKIADSDK